MTLQEQKEIASSFSDKFEGFPLDVELTKEEFSTFNKGVFTNNMAKKQNIFVVYDYIYWVRSWINACIYKAQISREGDFVKLVKGFVTRNRLEYNSDNIE